MAKAKQVKVSGKTRADVFNMSSPVLRVQTGNDTVKPETGKIIKWGAKDDLPHEYLRLISDSGTASSCLRRKQKFIFADGFLDETVAGFEVNEIQTADALLQDMAGDAACFSGIALRVRVVEGKVVAENLPFECVRKMDNGFFLFNPELGQKSVDKNLNEILPAYSTRENLLAEAAKDPKGMETKGQIYYYFEKVKGAYDYPIPAYASTGGLADMETDAELAKYDLDEVKSGFRPSAIITTIGEYEYELDKDGKPLPNEDEESVDNAVKAFTQREEGEPRKKVLHLKAPTLEMLPKVDILNSATNLNVVSEATDRVANKVCRNWNVPPVLIGLSKAGQLGQTQEIANMIQLFQMDIVGTQNMLQRIFAELWPTNELNAELDWTISTLNPLQFIPDYILGWLNSEQQQTLISRYI